MAPSAPGEPHSYLLTTTNRTRRDFSASLPRRCTTLPSDSTRMASKWCAFNFWPYFFVCRTNASAAQNIHAIGDRANGIVLDVFENILRKPGADVNAWRPRIEHAQIIQPSDLERIGRLGGSLHLF